jgi:hypothetical protein
MLYIKIFIGIMCIPHRLSENERGNIARWVRERMNTVFPTLSAYRLPPLCALSLGVFILSFEMTTQWRCLRKEGWESRQPTSLTLPMFTLSVAEI